MSLAAKSGRRAISRQTIRKILPKIDDWSNYMDESYPRISEFGKDGLRNSSGKLLALYKYIKHILIPELEEQYQGIEGTQKGIKVMSRLCYDISALKDKICDDDKKNEKKKSSERLNLDYDRMLISTIFCRNGELHRKVTHDKVGLTEDPNGFHHDQNKTREYYNVAIDILPSDPQNSRMITRRYKE